MKETESSYLRQIQLWKIYELSNCYMLNIKMRVLCACAHICIGVQR